MPPAVHAAGALERGRRAYEARNWADAHAALSQADEARSLGPDDLQLLATSAYMIGRDDELLRSLERAHQAYLDGQDAPRAARCAIWLCIHLALQREIGPASGWLSRANRLLEREQSDCVERGYALMPVVMQHVAAGEWQAGYDVAAEVIEVAERFGDRDLLALALLDQGRVLAELGRVEDGLQLLDEAMVAVTAGELSPVVTGFVYCSVIESCQLVHAIRRARQWTTALTAWCDAQPGMVPFTGTCLIHRAEIMQHHGEWDEALEEATQANRRFAERRAPWAAAQAAYRMGEIHRLQGRFAAAERAYRDAGRGGCEPQPGLSLLRLARGDADAAAAGIRRAVGEATDRTARATLLPAAVEILLTAGDVDGARDACKELEALADGDDGGLLAAQAAGAQGAVELAEGDALMALVSLRRAWRIWHELDAPYESARVRGLIGLACRAVGDDEAASIEIEAARESFRRLGAAPDLARTGPGDDGSDTHGLTPREIEVLRLIAAGHSNRVIATHLVLSERTVERHVSNILAKLGASSRTAATAYAYEHRLI